MKRILKKNQLIIAALAVMIAAAGYLNYSGRLLPGSQNTKEAGSDLANKELLDISDVYKRQIQDICQKEVSHRSGYLEIWRLEF